mgnify:CR=1 FL=1
MGAQTPHAAGLAANGKDCLLPINLDTLLRDTMRALGFLTRLPVAAKWFDGDDGKLTTTARAFPLAGAIASLPGIAVIVAGTLLDQPLLLTGVLTAMVQTAVGGGLHEDGLADVADGLFGGQDKARRLEIMKDSRIGTYGAITLAFALAIRTITIAAILQAGLLAAALSLLGSQALARSAMVWHWTNLPPAKSDGVAANSGQPDEASTHFALASGIGIALAAALFARGAIPALIGLALAAGATYVFRQLCNRKIAGYTGDTLGASAVLAELAFLTGLASGL